jgi:HrpA-like RNA helicase
VHYLLQPTPDYLTAAVEAVVEIHREDVPGDVLVFLTGVRWGRRSVRGVGRCESVIVGHGPEGCVVLGVAGSA